MLTADGRILAHRLATQEEAHRPYGGVVPEIAVAKVREDAPFDKVCYIGCGVTTGVGAVAFDAEVEPGSTVAVFGLGGIGLNVIQGARMVGPIELSGSMLILQRPFSALNLA
jgi:Zn-dependent alcohol dehydrogenase